MPIPLVIVYGHKDSFALLGWTARQCPRCKRPRPFECFSQTRSEHIYFIQLSSKDIGQIVVCDFCDSSYALGKSEQAKTDTKWRRNDEFSALISSTSPSLPITEYNKNPSDYEIRALLESLNEKGSVVSRDISKPLAIGAIVSAPVGGILLGGLSAIGLLSGLDTFGWAALGVIFGGGVGGTVWAILTGRRIAREIMLDSLKRSVTKHRLDRNQLLKVSQDGSLRLGRVRKLLEGFEK